MKHPDGRSTVIPVHPGEELGRGVLMEILNDAGLSKEEFIELLKGARPLLSVATSALASSLAPALPRPFTASLTVFPGS